jgi:threonine aldolase
MASRAGCAIDLISDNASQPTADMRQFMAAAPVGDEEFGEDPTVRALERAVAELTGKDDAVFLPSGTMANIVAYAVHCPRGDEILIDASSHPVYMAYAGPAVAGRARLRTLAGVGGVIAADEIARAAAVHPDARLLSLENTHNPGGGRVWPLDALDAACATAREWGLATHLDGARLLNATVATGVPVARYSEAFDSVWIDLSKGLGCPAGAVLAGDHAFVAAGRRAKALYGGVLHQGGILAAAGLYALAHHVERLAEDHARAAALAAALERLPGIELQQDRVETNIVYIGVERTGLTADDVLARLAGEGIRLKRISDCGLRAVTHLDIGDEHVTRVADAFATILGDPGDSEVQLTKA